MFHKHFRYMILPLVSIHKYLVTPSLPQRYLSSLWMALKKENATAMHCVEKWLRKANK